ncbi:hypothetical protein V1512DRAFT_222154 [Lipomyces arxii]|uniref:uncharacterized protein n=1 Tax=Lipomyces arxii TaxID=56418 RepID=UPI0034CF3A02
MTTSIENGLYDHFIAFASFANIQNDVVLPPPSSRQAKSRERLQRMPRVPFAELSTDVYDELIRRQKASRAQDLMTGEIVPQALGPQEGFHPKRNQTREHLAILQQSRFKDLVLDVYFEVVRRFPTYQIPADTSRQQAPTQDQVPIKNGVNSSVVTSPRSLSRPLPKTFHTTTVLPSKSKLVEKSEDSEDEEPTRPVPSPRSTKDVQSSTITSSPQSSPTTTTNSLASRWLGDKELKHDVMTQSSPTSSNSSTRTHSPVSTGTQDLTSAKQEVHSASDKQYAELLSQFELLEANYQTLLVEMTNVKREADVAKRLISEKDDTILSLSTQLENERNESQGNTSSLEEELFRTNGSNKKLHAEINVLETELTKARGRLASLQSVPVSDIDRQQFDTLNQQYANLSAEHDTLQTRLQLQNEVTEQVRTEALKFISEIRTLAQLDSSNRQRMERLSSQVKSLQTENRGLREKIVSDQIPQLSLPDRQGDIPSRNNRSTAASLFVSPQGLIPVSDFTDFQSSVDLLLSASSSITTADEQAYFLDLVRATVSNSKNVVADTDGNDTATTKLRTRVSQATNSLVLAAKTLVLSSGLAPVSILDASVCNLVECVIALVKTSKLKPTK